jgi:PAS domain S-box-containing protein
VRKSITLKLLVIITAAFILTTIGVLLMANRQLTRIINKSQETIYIDKIDSIIETISRHNERLEKTGLVYAYIKDFQERSVAILRKDHYGEAQPTIYPFIVNTDGKIVMHPIFPPGDISKNEIAVVSQIIAAAQESDGVASFNFTYLGVEKWYLVKEFPQWNWVVGYAVPLKEKYADVRQFTSLLIIIMLSTSLVVLIALSMLIRRFTKPITELTDAAVAMSTGNLEREIFAESEDELGILAKSFSDMRDSIKHTIEMLQEENAERIKTEKALESEKEQLAVTLRSIGEGVITTDVSGKIIMLNNIAETLTEWNSKDASGNNVEDVIRIVGEKSGQTKENPVKTVLSTGETYGLSLHSILISKNGIEKNVAYNAAPIINNKNQVIGAVLVFRDITDQIKTEQELLKLQKLESIGILAGGLAHDFNNILTAIIGNITLALSQKKISKQIKELLENAEKASLQAKNLTKQLLTFAKGGDPVRKTASLENIIEDSAEFAMHGDKIVIGYDIAKDLWLVDVDRGQISQVIQNIVINSTHAMPDGGEIKISARNVTGEEIPFPLNKDGCYVKISIADNGIGIPPKILEKVFDPYFSTKQEGSGLGLAISQSIINKHSGHISIESSPGKGTSFNVFLPASDKRCVDENIEETIPKDGTVKAKILIMDDDELVREVAKAMILSLGHSVETAVKGEDTIPLYKEAMESGKKFDLVIMDLTVPGGMGGEEAIKEILKIDPEAKVAVSSGYSNDRVMANFAQYGFSEAIVKPYELKELERLISSLLA